MTTVLCYHWESGNSFRINCDVFKIDRGVVKFYHYKEFFLDDYPPIPFRTIPCAADFNFTVRRA